MKYICVFVIFFKVTSAYNLQSCQGTNDGLSLPSNQSHHYQQLRERYTYCSHVIGNLEITWLQDQEYDLSFLQNIHTVSGYVLISHVNNFKISLPNLEYIHGENLFKIHDEVDGYGLFVSESKIFNLELPALISVANGNVGIYNSDNLCHVNSIEWQYIMQGKDSRFWHLPNTPSRECPPCHNTCENACWNEGPENCQRKVNLSMFKNTLPMFVQPESHQNHRECMGSLTFNPYDIVSSANIDSFKGCTMIHGSITILDRSFEGYSKMYPGHVSRKIRPMHPDMLEVFSNVKVITGYLRIQAKHPAFKNLAYFRSLEVIGGEKLGKYNSALYIEKTYLNSVELPSLKEITKGGVHIVFNKDLCHLHDGYWKNIVRSPKYKVIISNNCWQCHELCFTGKCWGPANDQCLKDMFY